MTKTIELSEDEIQSLLIILSEASPDEHVTQKDIDKLTERLEFIPAF